MDFFKNLLDSTNHADSGLFLCLQECKCLFRRLKKEEPFLQDEERSIFQRLEKVLYSRLSIKEIEEL